MIDDKIINITKKLVILFMVLTFINILLPDEFVIGIHRLDYRLNPFEVLIRWFNLVSFIALPVAIFYNKSIFKKIALYFCLPVLLIYIGFFPNIIEGYTSSAGTGIVDIRYLPDFIPLIMRNEIFRSVLFFVICLIEIAVIALMVINDRSFIKFKDKDLLNFIIILLAIIVSILPIYALEGIFDSHSNIKFKFMSLSHIIWMLMIPTEIYILYRIFRNKSLEDRTILLLVLSLSLFIQFNQLFSSLGELTCKRMPLQLCNLAAYIMLYSVVTKNRNAFLFNLLVNVIGAVIAVVILDADGSNLISKGNIHYIVEHNNVIVIPVLCLLLGVFEPVKKGDFKVFLKLFSCYFILIFALGTIFNALYLAFDSTFFKCNYLFMFDPDKGESLISFTKYLFKVEINIGYITIYPLLQGAVYLVFSFMGYLSYLVFKNVIKCRHVYTD